MAALFSCRAGERAFEHEKLGHGVFFYLVLEGLKGKAKDADGEITFASLASYVSRRVSRDVAELVGGGAKQSPNLKADYSAEPILLATTDTPATKAGSPEETAEQTFQRGWRFLKGEGVTADPANGIKLIRQAAEAGFTGAQFHLALLYVEGKTLPQDYTEAAKWYRRSADRGEAAAMTNLGALYASGQGVPKSDVEAARWYRKGAEAGDLHGQNNYAYAQEGGFDVPVNLPEALIWYRKSAEGGNPLAQFNLALLYNAGKGPRQDFAEAPYPRCTAGRRKGTTPLP